MASLLFLSKDAESYANWLKVSLKLLHTAVYKNRIESKQQMKEKYDKKHNVKEPDFKTGQKVLLLDRRIKSDSNRVLTHQPYSGPYIIKDVIRTDASIGPAYKLVHEITGKPVSRLVNFDLLKIFNEGAPNLDANSPQGIEKKSSDDVNANDYLSHKPSADSRPEMQKQTAKKVDIEASFTESN